MNTLKLIAANEENFFKRGKKLAKLADAGKPIPKELVISFEEPVTEFSLVQKLGSSGLQQP